MVSGILHNLGINMGKNIGKAHWSNPRGHFEEEQFIKLNDRILKAAGGTWAFPPSTEAITAQHNNFAVEIDRLLKLKPGNAWGWKDPRTSLTIGLYLQYLNEPYFLICHRNAKKVAQSLKRRNSLRVGAGQALAQLYEHRINEVFAVNPGLRRLDLFYEQVTDNPKTWIKNIIGFLDIKPSTEQFQAAVDSVLPEKKARHISNRKRLRYLLRRPGKIPKHFFTNKSVLHTHSKIGKKPLADQTHTTIQGRHIYYLCPDSNRPAGGIKVVYEHVDILNENGFSAFVLHGQKGFRCNWFHNETRVSDVKKCRLREQDFLAIPELYGKYYAEGISRSKKAKVFWESFNTPAKKIIFNQGCYLTFGGHALWNHDNGVLYRDPSVLATMVVSKDSAEYLRYAFPGHRIYRVHNAIDPYRFSLELNKSKQICFMPESNPRDLLQIAKILEQRRNNSSFHLVPIENRTEQEVADIFKKSLIYLNLRYHEGWGLPAAEAMCCGCIVIGYHGMGGKESFDPEFCYPVETGNIIEFVKAIEQVISLHQNNPQLLREKSERASQFIRNNYSLAQQRDDVIDTWKRIMADA